jgi:hypothetical protein
MTLRKTCITLLVACFLGLSGFVVATPASAAATGSIQDNADGTVTVTYSVGSVAGTIVDLLICPAGTVSCGFGARIYSLTTSGGSTLGPSPATIQAGTTVTRPMGAGTTALPSGNYVFSLVGTGGGLTGYAIDTNVSVTIGSGSGGGGSSTAAAPAPTFEIALTPTDGTRCVSSIASSTGGTWLTLPGANDCTPPASKAGATLLGWSTTPNFPVTIAQRQVTNGWGTYETFNDAGQITSVFIPAGRATLLSGTNTLYPIWNK